MENLNESVSAAASLCRCGCLHCINCCLRTNVDDNENCANNVTPFSVVGSVDYDRIVDEFGAKRIDETLVTKIESATGRRAHHFLRRDIFFTHRGLDTLVDSHKTCAEPFYLYTGRGPSSASLHFGHLVPLLFTKYLQSAFDVPLVVQMTDDEKFLFKADLTLEQTDIYMRENVRDLLALGFDTEKTFVFSNTSYIQTLYPNVLQIQKRVPAKTMRSVFGFSDNDAIGKWAFPCMQMAPAFSSSFPNVLDTFLADTLTSSERKKGLRCLVPCAIDQDPYFRVARDVAPHLGFHKPALVHSKFFPSLQGSQTKMSSSTSASSSGQSTTSSTNSTIFLSDTRKKIDKAIKKHAFSGGGASLEDQRRDGANLETDVSFQWLRFFMEDDHRLQQIGEDYSRGKLLTGEVKKVLSNVLANFAETHQKERERVKEEDIDNVMAIRSLT